MEFTGERVVYDKMPTHGYNDLVWHLERYIYAMNYVKEKRVIDAASGTCYGSWLMSLVAKEITMVDIEQEALDYGDFKFKCPSSKQRLDLSKGLEQEADVCVSFETIEHLTHPKTFLRSLNTKELVFSIPLDNPSKYHRHVFDEEGVEELMEQTNWNIKEHKIQANLFYLGHAIR